LALRGIGWVLSRRLDASVCCGVPAGRRAVGESGMMADMNYSNGSKRLVRRLDGRMVAGVCSGISDYFGIDVNLVRLGFVVATFIGFIGILAYLAAWVILPEEGESASIAENLFNKKPND
jgi:phage shock protein PspC (stress-responsive transcriptional regulator)